MPSSAASAIIGLLLAGLVGALLLLWRSRLRIARERLAAQELRHLYAFGRELLEARLDLDAMCTLIYEYCQQVAPAPGFAIQLREQSGAVFCPFIIAHGERLELSAQECDATAYDLIARTGEPLLLDNACAPDAPCRPLPLQDLIASAMYAPIRINDQVLGIVVLQSDQPAAFTRAQLQQVAAIATQAALGVQAATLLRQQQQRTAQLLLIAEVSRKVAAILDLQTLFRDAARLVQETFGYYHVSVYRLSPDGQSVILAASSDAEIERRGLTVPFGAGLVGHTAQEGSIHLANDVRESDLYLHEASLDRTRSELAIPLRVESRILGVLDLQSDSPQAFTEQDASVLQILADQIAVAIEDSHLYTLQRQQSRVSETLLQVANVLGGPASGLDNSIATVVQLTPRLVEVSWCLALVWPDNGRLPMLHTAGFDDEQAHQITVELGRRSREQVTTRWGGQRHLVAEPPDDLAELCPLLARHTPFMVVPLTAHEVIVGYLLAGAEHVQPLEGQAISLLTGIARQTSLAIETAMLYRRMLRQQQFEHEMHLARDIQMSFMPESLPTPPGWDVAVAWQAAHGVSGDFYDFIRLDENRLGIVIADVSDKGVAAALYMALSRTVMRSTALEGYSAARTLERTNSLLLQESRSGMFVTMFYGILDLRTGLLRYARGGHNPPLLLRTAHAAIEQLYSPGTVLGVLDDPEIEQRTTVLYPGDVLLLYTDGVTEASAPAGAEFGVEGLEAAALAAVRAAVSQPAEQIISAVSQAQQAFTGSGDPHDDFTLVVVRRAQIAQEVEAGGAEA
jgi:serine phosphatase RsbU (regulator of sigma subunit)